jgi:hypothetical protein
MSSFELSVLVDCSRGYNQCERGEFPFVVCANGMGVQYA